MKLKSIKKPYFLPMIWFPCHFLIWLLPCVKTSLFSGVYCNGYQAWFGAGGNRASFGGILLLITIVFASIVSFIALPSDNDFIKAAGTYSVLSASLLISVLSFCGASGLMVYGAAHEYFTLAAGAVIVGILNLLPTLCLTGYILLMRLIFRNGNPCQ